LEARLDEKLVARKAITGTQPETIASATPRDADASESVVVVEGVSPGEDASVPIWPDASAESAFLAEARQRGETLAPAKPRQDVTEESDSGPLPPLNELVERIPPEVREALDDLFRAKFTNVRRVPSKALKG